MRPSWDPEDDSTPDAGNGLGDGGGVRAPQAPVLRSLEPSANPAEVDAAPAAVAPAAVPPDPKAARKMRKGMSKIAALDHKLQELQAQQAANAKVLREIAALEEGSVSVADDDAASRHQRKLGGGSEPPEASDDGGDGQPAPPSGVGAAAAAAFNRDGFRPRQWEVTESVTPSARSSAGSAGAGSASARSLRAGDAASASAASSSRRRKGTPRRSARGDAWGSPRSHVSGASAPGSEDFVARNKELAVKSKHRRFTEKELTRLRQLIGPDDDDEKEDAAITAAKAKAAADLGVDPATLLGDGKDVASAGAGAGAGSGAGAGAGARSGNSSSSTPSNAAEHDGADGVLLALEDEGFKPSEDDAARLKACEQRLAAIMDAGQACDAANTPYPRPLRLFPVFLTALESQSVWDSSERAPDEDDRANDFDHVDVTMRGGGGGGSSKDASDDDDDDDAKDSDSDSDGAGDGDVTPPRHQFPAGSGAAAVARARVEAEAADGVRGSPSKRWNLGKLEKKLKLKQAQKRRIVSAGLWATSSSDGGDTGTGGGTGTASASAAAEADVAVATAAAFAEQPQRRRAQRKPPIPKQRHGTSPLRLPSATGSGGRSRHGHGHGRERGGGPPLVPKGAKSSRKKTQDDYLTAVRAEHQQRQRMQMIDSALALLKDGSPLWTPRTGTPSAAGGAGSVVSARTAASAATVTRPVCRQDIVAEIAKAKQQVKKTDVVSRDRVTALVRELTAAMPRDAVVPPPPPPSSAWTERPNVRELLARPPPVRTTTPSDSPPSGALPSGGVWPPPSPL